MTRLVLAAAAVTLLAVPGVAGCARSNDGTAVRAESSVSTTSTTTSSSPSSATASDTPESAEPGVLETTRRPVPANMQVCPQDLTGPTAVATVSDPAAPEITVALPDGWSAAPGSGDVGARLTGPDDMLAEITIAATPLEPAAAFSRYSDDLMGKYPISTLSLLPADLCGYSGQKLMGTWADDPDEAIQYQDRIAHIWTNSANYLVTVHVEAPSGTAGFDAAADTLTSDFGIVIP
ncbi:MAG: hypothetical protein U0Q47_02710 [Mycobacterium sp.]